jgi:hypothetical protein
MTWSVIEKKKALHPPVRLLLKDIDGAVDLLMEMVSAEVSVTIFACLEYYPSVTVHLDQRGRGGGKSEERKKMHLFP